MSRAYRIVIIGLSVTSSWGNGHATTYRALMRALDRRGHEVLFLERDVPWYRDNRDLPAPPYGRTCLYRSLDELRAEHAEAVRTADLVVVGSYVPDGIAVGEWVTGVAEGVSAFYDIDTPVTLAALERGGAAYLSRELIPRYDLYLSFTGGPTLRRLEREFGSPMARALYCSVDPQAYYPQADDPEWDLGYLGTYAADRQPALERLLLEPARSRPESRFVAAGPAYPEDVDWPRNVKRIEHLPPSEHRGFYNRQRLTLNITRADMVRAGYSPSVRLFEAAACGVPIISDRWPGLDTLFEPGREIFTADTAAQVLRVLSLPADELREVGERARRRVLGTHTAAHRAGELEAYLEAAGEYRRPRRRSTGASASAGGRP